MLQDLGQLQQLTLLHLTNGLPMERGYMVAVRDFAPAAAYSALTASSNLRHLDIADNRLPAGAWQHVFPDGRLLPHLTSLDLSEVCDDGGLLPVPEVTRLVSSCPALKALYLWEACNTVPIPAVPAELLAPLQQLSGLQTLHLSPAVWTPAAMPGLSPALCQLTGLRELRLWQNSNAEEGLLLHLTQLRHLTSLEYVGRLNGVHKNYNFRWKVRFVEGGERELWLCGRMQSSSGTCRGVLCCCRALAMRLSGARCCAATLTTLVARWQPRRPRHCWQQSDPV
jgi:hypothetical protein